MEQTHSALFELYDTLTDELYLGVVDRIVKINKEDIASDLIKDAINYTHYSVLEAKAKRDLSKLELDLEMETSRLKKQMYSNPPKGTRITKEFLDAYICQDENVLGIKKALIEAEHKLELMKRLMKALEFRHNNLIQLSADKRQEMKVYS